MTEEMKKQMLETVLEGLRKEGHKDPQAALDRMVDEYWGRKPDTNYGNWKKLID